MAEEEKLKLGKGAAFDKSRPHTAQLHVPELHLAVRPVHGPTAHAGRQGPAVGRERHGMGRPVVVGSHPSVRYLTGEDSDLMRAAPIGIEGACLGFGTFERLLEAGFVVGAVIDGKLVAVASTWAVSERYADLAVITAGPWRGRGLATACAGLVAAGVRRSGRMPVWSTGEDNLASLRVARRLGFEEVGRRTYVNAISEGHESR